MASENLREFLVRLSEGGDLYNDYMKDPNGTMTKAGLSAEEQSLVLSGDGEALNKYLGDNLSCAAIAKFSEG